MHIQTKISVRQSSPNPNHLLAATPNHHYIFKSVKLLVTLNHKGILERGGDYLKFQRIIHIIINLKLQCKTHTEIIFSIHFQCKILLNSTHRLKIL